MAVTFFPFNSIVIDGVPDRPAKAENLAAYLAGFFSNGVLLQEDTALKVEAYSGMEVQIHAGMGNINGKTILNDAAEIVTLAAANASLDRIDRVVFRLDEVNRLMEFDVLIGTPASDPVAPELTQGADVYEMCLAEIRVPAGASEILASYITDTRADANLCGLASIPPHMQDLEHGGTGISAETKEALLLALGGNSIVELWSNASTSSDFAAQNISVPTMDEYNFFLVEYRILSSATSRKWEIIRKGNVFTASEVLNIESTSTNVWVRRLTTVDSTNKKFTFAAATSKSGLTGSTTTANKYLIPCKIYGIKGVQFL